MMLVLMKTNIRLLTDLDLLMYAWTNKFPVQCSCCWRLSAMIWSFSYPPVLPLDISLNIDYSSNDGPDWNTAAFFCSVAPHKWRRGSPSCLQVWYDSADTWGPPGKLNYSGVQLSRTPLVVTSVAQEQTGEQQDKTADLSVLNNGIHLFIE